MNLWLTDPKNGEKSVSLTLLFVASALMLVAIGLDSFGILKASALLDQFFWGTAALYFGRKISTKRGENTTDVSGSEEKK